MSGRRAAVQIANSKAHSRKGGVADGGPKRDKWEIQSVENTLDQLKKEREQRQGIPIEKQP